MQGMGWTCIEELVWGDSEHTWVRPGTLHTRGPGPCCYHFGPGILVHRLPQPLLAGLAEAHVRSRSIPAGDKLLYHFRHIQDPDGQRHRSRLPGDATQGALMTLPACGLAEARKHQRGCRSWVTQQADALQRIHPWLNWRQDPRLFKPCCRTRRATARRWRTRPRPSASRPSSWAPPCSSR